MEQKWKCLRTTHPVSLGLNPRFFISQTKVLCEGVLSFQDLFGSKSFYKFGEILQLQKGRPHLTGKDHVKSKADRKKMLEMFRTKAVTKICPKRSRGLQVLRRRRGKLLRYIFGPGGDFGNDAPTFASSKTSSSNENEIELNSELTELQNAPKTTSCHLTLFESLWAHFAPKSAFLLHFHKIRPTRSQMCRTALIRIALESPDPSASNDGFRPLGIDLVTFEVAGAANN